jgi:hypothetical protein
MAGYYRGTSRTQGHGPAGGSSTANIASDLVPDAASALAGLSYHVVRPLAERLITPLSESDALRKWRVNSKRSRICFDELRESCRIEIEPPMMRVRHGRTLPPIGAARPCSVGECTLLDRRLADRGAAAGVFV